MSSYWENHRRRIQQEEERLHRLQRRNSRASALLLLVGVIAVAAMQFRSPGVSTRRTAAAVSSAATVSADHAALAADWRLLLVGRHNPLPQNFSVPLTRRSDGYEVDTRTASELAQMLAAAQTQGVTLQLSSAYRSAGQQQTLHQLGSEQPVGQSEHQTGLAVDLVTPEHQQPDAGFATTKAFAWLQQHAQEYGYVVRYPQQKETTTGVAYAPWHYRYVGRAYAVDMKQRNMCLEEYRRALGL